ncbi:S-layer homology domain-containing protein [Paenibacillus cremeus]|uniref:S-layer homology domain-containing protein n=1 Tax=Paenibacillus cremeus TaxID=2163881 RepID=A0A559K8U0_9BACL|nr:S-layer homology domain-containing protein [Paenibacillus cremeus]TVY08538.1 S-layer homology domain-containing protein [Paenibacillus cremeus]
MKPAILQKTAQVTVTLLILSMLLPVLAFASSGFKNVSYKNGTVTGTVYSDVYSVSSQVYMYDPSGHQLAVTGVTYSVYDGVYNYSFSASGLSTYSYLNLYGPVGGTPVADSVYQAVYLTTDPVNGGGGYGGGGGGGGWASSDSISVYASGFVSSDQLLNSFNQYDTVTLSLSGDFALIPAKALNSFTSDPKKLLKVTNSNGTYSIPLNVLKLQPLADSVGVSVDDLTLKVSISQASSATANSVTAAAAQLGGTLASSVVDFNIVGLGKDNKTAPLDLGNSYLSRTLPLTKTVNPNQATAVWYNESTQKLSFVPAVFSGQSAEIKRNGSSLYAVIELNKSFNDTHGHWAESNITLLANKLVVDGVTDTTFQPERSITRAEFAALVVRSLGLATTGTSSSFKDVAASDWFAGVVGAAVNAKIIDGYEDGTFRPSASINREELAAMVVRALAYAGAKPDVSSEQQAALLAKFKDASSIVWAQNEIAVAISAGIIDGMTDDTLGARGTATRAQSATMLKRLLTSAKFIN